MYEGYFRLTERPFSIAPDPQYLYMSARHKEATAHLSYGLTQGGCFIVLTGEVGTGKTTLCRNLLNDLPKNVDVALILNANINKSELLQTVCDELKIKYRNSNSQKQLLDLINLHLLRTFAKNRHTVLIIDEAQLLGRDVLEQVRLLTNLETTKSKLLQIILIGQPELNDLLSRNDLRQLAQRVTARYHLGPLDRSEIESYINFRLGVAGCKQALFSRQALNKMFSLTSGIPRKINVLADHALLSTYSKNQAVVDAKLVKKAAQDVFITKRSFKRRGVTSKHWWILAILFFLLNLTAWVFLFGKTNDSEHIGSERSARLTAPQSNSIDQGKSQSGQTPDLSNKSSAPLNEQKTAKSNTVPKQKSLNVKKTRSKRSNASLLEPSQTSTKVNNRKKLGTVKFADGNLDDSRSLTTDSVSATKVNESSDFDEKTEFGNVLEISADLTGLSAANRVLARQWKIELPTPLIKTSCKELRRYRLDCIAPFSWSNLIRLNRPATISLRHLNQLHRVVLIGINNDIATVLVGTNKYQVSITELRARWDEKATIVWRPGVIGDRLLQLGDTYPKLGRVRRYLNLVLAKVDIPILENVTSTAFDREMSRNVFALQTRFGIEVDSKIGFETYTLMNEILGPVNTPVLTKRVQ